MTDLLNLLKPLLDHLPPEWVHAVTTVLAVIGFLRFTVKPWAGKFQAWMTAKIHAASLTQDNEDDMMWLKLLENPVYRAVNFWLFDTLLSLKLPTADSLLLHESKLIEQPDPPAPTPPNQPASLKDGAAQRLRLP